MTNERHDMNFKRLGLLVPMATTICNLLMMYVVYFVARLVYLFVNFSYFSQGLTWAHLLELFEGGLVFDTAAILVTNIPYIVLMLLPWHGKETKTYHNICRWEFLVINGLALAMNLCDSVYFRYTIYILTNDNHPAVKYLPRRSNRRTPQAW